MHPETSSLQVKAIRSFKWSALLQVVTRITAPLVFVILARILQQSDYGVMSVAMVVIGFSQIFLDAGLGKTLIQIEKSVEESADIVFWVNLGLGGVVYAVLFITAPWVASFFNSIESAPVIRILGITVLLTSLTTVQQSLMLRRLSFKPLFWAKLITGFVPGLFSILLALMGFGVWALVTGNLLGTFLNLIILWAISPWRPRLWFDSVLARSLFGFSLWVVAESFASWFFAWGDNLLVGKFLGISDLGIYQLAWNITTLIFTTITGTFTTVLYPTFSRLQNDRESLLKAFHLSNRFLMAITLPMGFGLLLVGSRLETVVFGVQWQGLGLILGLIGTLQGLFGLVAFNTELYRAIGRPDINSKLLLAFVLYYFPVYIIAAPLGLQVFTYARLAVGIPSLFIHAFVCSNLLNISPLYLWNDSKAIWGAVAVMACGALGTELLCNYANLLDGFTLVAMILCGIIFYGFSLYWFDGKFFLRNWKLLTQTGTQG